MCLRASQKGSLAQTKLQVNKIHSYFTKATQDGTQGTSSKQNRAQNEVVRKAAPKAAHPPKTPLPTLGLPHEPLGDTLGDTSTHSNPAPDAHALILLASIDRAAQELPSTIPEAGEDGHIAQVVLAGGPEDPSEAWEHLDRALNRLLGYGIDINEIAQRVRRGPWGIGGLTQYIRGFVVEYGIAGALLEGKLERLLKAIELIKQSVRVKQSNGYYAYHTSERRHGKRSVASVSPSLSPLFSPGDLLDENPTHADSLPPSSPPVSSPVLRSENAGDDISDDDDDIEYIGTSPAYAIIEDTIPLVPEPNTLTSPSVVLHKPVKCTQHVVSAPPGQTGIGAYPFLLHIEQHTPWDFSSRGGSLLLCARKCEDINLDEHGLCQPCQALLSNTKFRNMLARIETGVNENAPYKFHGLTSLVKIARKKDRTINLFRLRQTNDAKKLVRREGTITLHHQVLLAMSSGKIPRMDRVLRVAADRRMSVAAILDLIRKAGWGLYHPKGFDEDEDMQTLLFLRLGGQRVADIAHRMFGIPAPSTVCRRTMIPPLVCSPSYPLVRDLEANLVAAFDSLSPTLAAQGKYHVVLMLDEIAQETRPQWCDRTNQILGWCREHTKGRCMDFNSIADAELLFQDMESGDVHLAHEVSAQFSHGLAQLICLT